MAILRFRPRLLPSILALVALPVFVGLGFWQLERGALKEDLLTEFRERAQADAVPLGRDPVAVEALAFRKVRLAGRYLAHRNVLHDNRIEDSRAGYHVLTPFVLAGSGQVVLVNRGWVPLTGRREILPDFDTPEAPLRLVGTAVQPLEGLVIGPEETREASWPKVVQAIDLPALEAALGVELLPIVVLLDPDQPSGFARSWAPFHGIGPDKHRAYALQWFTFAALVVVLYIALNIRREAPPQ